MIAIRFDGPPAHLSGRFVEVEQDGKSICFGEWKRDGKDWLLVLPEKERLYGLVSYCAKHDTYPAEGEPCWQCANSHIIAAGEGIAQLKTKIEDLEFVLYEVSQGRSIPHRYGVTYRHITCRCEVHRLDLRDKIAAAKPGDTIIHRCDDMFGAKEIVFTKDEILDAIKKLWPEE